MGVGVGGDDRPLRVYGLVVLEWVQVRSWEGSCGCILSLSFSLPARSSSDSICRSEAGTHDDDDSKYMPFAHITTSSRSPSVAYFPPQRAWGELGGKKKKLWTMHSSSDSIQPDVPVSNVPLVVMHFVFLSLSSFLPSLRSARLEAQRPGRRVLLACGGH